MWSEWSWVMNTARTASGMIPFCLSAATVFLQLAPTSISIPPDGEPIK